MPGVVSWNFVTNQMDWNFKFHKVPFFLAYHWKQRVVKYELSLRRVPCHVTVTRVTCQVQVPFNSLRYTSLRWKWHRISSLLLRVVHTQISRGYVYWLCALGEIFWFRATHLATTHALYLRWFLQENYHISEVVMPCFIVSCNFSPGVVVISLPANRLITTTPI